MEWSKGSAIIQGRRGCFCEESCLRANDCCPGYTSVCNDDNGEGEDNGDGSDDGSMTTAKVTTKKPSALCQGIPDPEGCAAEVFRNGCDATIAGAPLKEHCPGTCNSCEPLCGDIVDREFCRNVNMKAFCGKSYLSIADVSAACPGVCGACPSPNEVDGTYFKYELTYNSLGNGLKLMFSTADDESEHVFRLPDRQCETAVSLSDCQQTCNQYQQCLGVYMRRDSSGRIQCIGLKSLGSKPSKCTDSLCASHTRTYYGPPLESGVLPGELAANPSRCDEGIPSIDSTTVPCVEAMTKGLCDGEGVWSKGGCPVMVSKACRTQCGFCGLNTTSSSTTATGTTTTSTTSTTTATETSTTDTTSTTVTTSTVTSVTSTTSTETTKTTITFTTTTATTVTMTTVTTDPDATDAPVTEAPAATTTSTTVQGPTYKVLYSATKGAIGRFSTALEAKKRLFALPDPLKAGLVTTAQCQARCTSIEVCSGVYLFQSDDGIMNCYGLSDLGVGIEAVHCESMICLSLVRQAPTTTSTATTVTTFTTQTTTTTVIAQECDGCFPGTSGYCKDDGIGLCVPADSIINGIAKCPAGTKSCGGSSGESDGDSGESASAQFCVGQLSNTTSNVTYNLFGEGGDCSDAPYNWAHKASFTAYTKRPANDAVQTVVWCIGYNSNTFVDSFFKPTTTDTELCVAPTPDWVVREIYLPRYPSQETLSICIRELESKLPAVSTPVYTFRALGRSHEVFGFAPCDAPDDGKNWSQPKYVNVLDPCDPGFQMNDGLYACLNINECETGAADCDDKADCTDTKGGFECSCSAGWVDKEDANLLPGRACKNIDECAKQTDNCNSNAKCDDTEGSFSCECNTGWVGSGVECTDFDECKPENSANNTCVSAPAGLCKNTEGSYECSCGPGWSGHTCLNVNECKTGEAMCDENAKCDDTEGSFVCSCNLGWDGPGSYSDGTVCKDANECSPVDGARKHNCDVNAVCINFEGSFSCKCNSGYRGDDGTRCTDIDECTETTLAEVDSDSSGSGDRANDNSTVADILPLHTCHAKAICTNLNSTYACTCGNGWEGDGRTCEDINECRQGSQSPCSDHASCTNSAGSYTCTCDAGWDGDGTVCKDVNECSDANNVCSPHATCFEMDDSFVCGRREAVGSVPNRTMNVCNYGYDGDGINCTDVNECDKAKELGTVACLGNVVCNNTVGSFDCICALGYKLNATSGLCDDVNECVEAGIAKCSIADGNATCENTDGSFECPCSAGYAVAVGGIGCTDILECSDGTDTCGPNYKCNEEPGSYSCSCLPGFEEHDTGTVDAKCVDVDECSLQTHRCHAHAACTDASGSYTCSCKTGYSGDGFHCENINECDRTDSNSISKPFDSSVGGGSGDYDDDDELMVGNNDMCHAQATCMDTVGSFTCECDSGWYGTGDAVQDGCTNVNECLSSSISPCGNNQICIDELPLDGKPPFYCKCDGQFWEAMKTDALGNDLVCKDINECDDQKTRECCEGNALANGFGTCYNSQYGYNCKCDPGYEILNSAECGMKCVDIDECKTRNPCGATEKCVNTFGGHKCEVVKECDDEDDNLQPCDPGYECNNNNKCDDKDECKVGKDHDCTKDDGEHPCVNTEGSYYCDCGVGCTVENSCSGYAWDSIFKECKDAVDECAGVNAANLCSNSRECHNTVGSYSCSCNETAGWNHVGNDVCRHSFSLYVADHLESQNVTVPHADMEDAIRSVFYAPAGTFPNAFTVEIDSSDTCVGKAVKVTIVLQDGVEGEPLSAQTLRMENTIEQVPVADSSESLLVYRPAACVLLASARSPNKGAQLDWQTIAGIAAGSFCVIVLFLAVYCCGGSEVPSKSRPSTDLGAIESSRPHTMYVASPQMSPHHDTFQMDTFNNGNLSVISYDDGHGQSHEALLNICSTFSWMHGPHFGGATQIRRARSALASSQIETGCFLVFTDEDPMMAGTETASGYTLLYTFRGEVVEDRLEYNSGGRLNINGREHGPWRHIEHMLPDILNPATQVDFLKAKLHTWIDRVTMLPVRVSDANVLEGLGYRDMFNWLQAKPDEMQQELEQARRGQSRAVDVYRTLRGDSMMPSPANRSINLSAEYSLRDSSVRSEMNADTHV